MRSAFRHYYAPTDEEFDQLWSEGLIVLDTNVLFNLYRYSLTTRSSMLSTLSALADQLWLPYQVAMEYQRGRIRVMAQQRAAYSKLRGLVGKFEESIEAKLKEHSRHPILEANTTMQVVRTSTDAIREHLDAAESKHPDFPKDSAPGSMDEIRDTLSALFEGRVGESFSSDDLELIYWQGAERYENQIPPGYRDQNDKEGDDRFGDLVIWKEVIRQAQAVQRPIIFVTDDRKEDWWAQYEGRTVGPRPELLAEIWRETGVLFHMYQPNQFLERAKDRISQPDFITADAVTEVKHVSDSDSRHLEKLSAYRGELMRRLADIDQRQMNTMRRIQNLERRGPSGFPGTQDRRAREHEQELRRLHAEVEGLHRHLDRAGSDPSLVGAEREQMLEALSTEIQDAMHRLTSREEAHWVSLREAEESNQSRWMHSRHSAESEMQSSEVERAQIEAEIDDLNRLLSE
ncbi:MAG: hypothetical protein JWM47_1494 [Acidimicrobiales bacterium]|nr:hypothetical protein [Acidimicrobiales bacterium]